MMKFLENFFLMKHRLVYSTKHYMKTNGLIEGTYVCVICTPLIYSRYLYLRDLRLRHTLVP